jgi:hypothetical protein
MSFTTVIRPRARLSARAPVRHPTILTGPKAPRTTLHLKATAADLSPEVVTAPARSPH